MRLEHVALWAQDLERLRAFYADHFGATAGPRYVNPHTGFTAYFLSFGEGARLELMNRPNLLPAPTDPAAARPGLAHLAISVGSAAEVDRLTHQLQQEGLPVLSGPRWTGDGYYESVVLDPEGNRLEITR